MAKTAMESSEYPLVAMVDDHEHQGLSSRDGKGAKGLEGANGEADEASKSGSDADPKAEKPKQVGFFQLFRFADRLDMVLIAIGVCKPCLPDSCAALDMPGLAALGIKLLCI